MALRASKGRNVPLAPLPPSPNNPLGVIWIKQKQTEWCWAACADMVLDFYQDPNVDQCHLANSASGAAGGTCCANPTSQTCNRPLSDAEISQLWTTHGIQRIPRASQVAFLEIQIEITAGRPVEVAWSRNVGDHLVIVHGWRVTSAGEEVYVNDPAKGGGEGWMSFLDLRTARGTGFWDSTWVGLKR